MGRKKIEPKKKIGLKNIGRYIGHHTHRAMPPYTTTAASFSFFIIYTKIA